MPPVLRSERSAPRINPAALDPLPRDVAAIVFAELSAADLLRCRAVSRSWRASVSDPRLWRDVRVDAVLSRRAARVLREASRLARGEMRRLTLHVQQPASRGRAGGLAASLRAAGLEHLVLHGDMGDAALESLLFALERHPTLQEVTVALSPDQARAGAAMARLLDASPAIRRFAIVGALNEGPGLVSFFEAVRRASSLRTLEIRFGAVSGRCMREVVWATVDGSNSLCAVRFSGVPNSQ